MPGTLVSSSPSAPAAAPVSTKPFSSRATTSPSQSVHGAAPEEQEQERERDPLAVGQGDGLELAVAAVQLRHLAAVAHRDPVALELDDQVVGHRLAQVGAAVQERDQRAAAGQPDRGLRGRVAAADHADARRRRSAAPRAARRRRRCSCPRTRRGRRPAAGGSRPPWPAAQPGRRSRDRPPAARRGGRCRARAPARGTGSRCGR